MRKSFSYLDQTAAFLVPVDRRREFIEVGSIGRLEGLEVPVPNETYLQRLRHAAPDVG